MSPGRRPAVGIFGAGKVGLVLARLASGAGYTVHLASSGTASETAAVTRHAVPRAIATDGGDLAASAGLLILAVPLRRFRELPLRTMAGRTIVDVMNYWRPVDGNLPELEPHDRPTSLVVRDALPPTARLVKTFNHLGYHQLDELPRAAGATDRVSLGVAGDDASAVQAVSRLVADVGFDPVPAGCLACSRVLELGSEVFGRPLPQHRMRELLHVQRTTADQAARPGSATPAPNVGDSGGRCAISCRHATMR